MRLLNWPLKRNGAYERTLEALTKSGYVIKSTPEVEILGRPTPEGVAVIYLSQLQEGGKTPTDYTTKDVLRDMPQELLLTDMYTGKSAWLRLK